MDSLSVDTVGGNKKAGPGGHIEGYLYEYKYEFKYKQRSISIKL